MKKNLFRTVVALVLIASMMFAGCGRKARTADFTVPKGGYDGSAVTIKFYHTMGQNLSEVLELYIAEFNKLYPKITVEHEQIGGYDDVRGQLATEISVGNEPNIAYCYPDHVALYNLASSVVRLDNLIASTEEVTLPDGTKEVLGLTDAQKNDFVEGYYSEGSSFGDGHMYTLPFSKSTEVLYYNKTFFEANNLSVPKTWDEMEALCKKIKEIDPQSIPLGYDSEANWFITMTEQLKTPYTSASGSNPEDHYLFNTAENREFVKKFASWYTQGLLTTQGLYGTYTSGLFINIPTEKNPTRSYMSIGSSAGATHQRPLKVNEQYPFEVGIAPIPQADSSNPKVISQGPSVCIFQKDNPQEVIASWLFAKFLTTSVDFQAEFSAASGYVPVLKSVANSDAYKAFLAKADGYDNVAALSVKVCVDQMNAYYVSPAFNGSSTARDEVGDMMQKIMLGAAEHKADLDAFIEGIFKDKVNKCIEEE